MWSTRIGRSGKITQWVANLGGSTFRLYHMVRCALNMMYLSWLPCTGTAHLVFHSTGHHYTWSKVFTYIHNIIIGKLWIDQVSSFKDHVIAL